jgi:hypothetical protein
MSFRCTAADDRPLVRAAWHEAAHATAAHVYYLPIRDVWIDAEGYGGTRYTRYFNRADIHTWLIATLAGPEIELMLWGNAPIGGDLGVIEAMVRDTRYEPWNDRVLARYRRRAARFVRRERDLIDVVAYGLLQQPSHRLSAREIESLVATWNSRRGAPSSQHGTD